MKQKRNASKRPQQSAALRQQATTATAATTAATTATAAGGSSKKKKNGVQEVEGGSKSTISAAFSSPSPLSSSSMPKTATPTKKRMVNDEQKQRELHVLVNRRYQTRHTVSKLLKNCDGDAATKQMTGTTSVETSEAASDHSVQGLRRSPRKSTSPYKRSSAANTAKKAKLVPAQKKKQQGTSTATTIKKKKRRRRAAARRKQHRSRASSNAPTLSARSVSIITPEEALTIAGFQPFSLYADSNIRDLYRLLFQLAQMRLYSFTHSWVSKRDRLLFFPEANVELSFKRFVTVLQEHGVAVEHLVTNADTLGDGHFLVKRDEITWKRPQCKYVRGKNGLVYQDRRFEVSSFLFWLCGVTEPEELPFLHSRPDQLKPRCEFGFHGSRRGFKHKRKLCLNPAHYTTNDLSNLKDCWKTCFKSNPAFEHEIRMPGDKALCFCDECHVRSMWLVSKIKGYQIPKEVDEQVKRTSTPEFLESVSTYISRVIYSPAFRNARA
ncbi:hypothetical protein PTSG_11328 [Salpingoeca rosetta]|uniref:Uncharacterized protein n=1 Tax=Salpingoeca rosetta (strain ATCC 50818 / BSB-021) TaxID=946362 RepID=F2UT32_SALR5|nr:uncharacterized protein PTSG_11328 [Salpingoeca rosetta]EGD81291.1 hypothetical protein PTSG_11328 [Salpingoeca rosetta]|eukprot:XP_004987687.1 hypothetical protein PTSG_11328 [Salpingoeca rosetta]